MIGLGFVFKLVVVIKILSNASLMNSNAPYDKRTKAKNSRENNLDSEYKWNLRNNKVDN